MIDGEIQSIIPTFSFAEFPMDASRRSLCISLPILLSSLAASTQDQSLSSFVTPFDKLEAKKTGTNTMRPILNGKTESGAQMEVHETILAPGSSPHPPHRHKHDELFLISKGSLEVTIAGKTSTIGPGSAAYVHSGEEHGVRNSGSVDAQYFVVATGTEV
jgi:mannose-6-phosphate isomerase-like protein (cupin superfamily)